MQDGLIGQELVWSFNRVIIIYQLFIICNLLVTSYFILIKVWIQKILRFLRQERFYVFLEVLCIFYFFNKFFDFVFIENLMRKYLLEVFVYGCLRVLGIQFNYVYMKVMIV